MEWAMVESLVEESYRMIAPKRLAATTIEGTARRKPSKKKR
jgi:hypothetical protein